MREIDLVLKAARRGQGVHLRILADGLDPSCGPLHSSLMQGLFIPAGSSPNIYGVPVPTRHSLSLNGSEAPKKDAEKTGGSIATAPLSAPLCDALPSQLLHSTPLCDAMGGQQPHTRRTHKQELGLLPPSYMPCALPASLVRPHWHALGPGPVAAGMFVCRDGTEGSETVSK